MRYRLLLVMTVTATALTALVATADAQMRATSPGPRDVAERMETCMADHFQIVELGDAGDVLVTAPGGSFGIKEIDVPRIAGAASIMLSRNPRYSLLYLTFPEQVGNGYVNLDRPDLFQRRAVDCFYGSYIGQDVVK